MRILLAGILGGIAMFVWTSVAHIVLPLGQSGISQMQNESVVIPAMKNATGDKDGLYFFPWVDMNAPDAMARAEAQLKVSPSGLLIYHPAGATGMTPVMLGFEFAKEVIVSFVAALLLSMTVIATYFLRVAFVSLIGLAAALTTNISYWIWYGFPVNYTAAYAVTDFLGYVAAGLVIAWIVRRTHQPL